MRVRVFLIGRGAVLNTMPPDKKHAFTICKFRWSAQVVSWRDFPKHRIYRQIRSKQQTSEGRKGKLLAGASLIDIFIISLTNAYSLQLNESKNNSKYCQRQFCILEPTGERQYWICWLWSLKTLSNANIISYSVCDWWVNGYETLMELCWQGKTKVLARKLSQYHFVHHKFHRKWPEIEAGLQRWAIGLSHCDLDVI